MVACAVSFNVFPILAGCCCYSSILSFDVIKPPSGLILVPLATNFIRPLRNMKVHDVVVLIYLELVGCPRCLFGVLYDVPLGSVSQGDRQTVVPLSP